MVAAILMQYPLSIFMANRLLRLCNNSIEDSSVMERFNWGLISRVLCGLAFYPLHTVLTRLQMRPATGGKTDQPKLR